MSVSLLDRLRAKLGNTGVLASADAMAPFLTDWRGVFSGKALAVARPANTGEVTDVVRICVEAGVAIVPQGGNTGLAAGATPVGLDSAVVVNVSRMRSIRGIDSRGNTIALDAGCVLSDVQSAAKEAGRLFPLSLAAEGSAQIGGLIATNAGGTAVLRYGSMRSLVLGLEVVLADGTIVNGMRSLRKDNAGYDWKQWFIGSEGTLGIVTGSVLRLFPAPRTMLTALVAIESLEAAMDVFWRAQDDFGELLVGAEVFPDRAVALRLGQEPKQAFPLQRNAWYLLLEVASSLDGANDVLETALVRLVEELGVDCAVAQSASQRDALWEWRETIGETEKRAGKSAKHDVSVPVSAIPAFVRDATAAIEGAFADCPVLAFGHAGDGNVHFNVMLPPDDSVSATAVNAVVHEIVVRYDGSITAEHGIGRYRRSELRQSRSAVELEMMNGLKRALDPLGVMNPGAVL